jgi:hypothetical protein
MRSTMHCSRRLLRAWTETFEPWHTSVTQVLASDASSGEVIRGKGRSSWSIRNMVARSCRISSNDFRILYECRCLRVWF